MSEPSNLDTLIQRLRAAAASHDPDHPPMGPPLGGWHTQISRLQALHEQPALSDPHHPSLAELMAVGYSDALFINLLYYHLLGHLPDAQGGAHYREMVQHQGRLATLIELVRGAPVRAYIQQQGITLPATLIRLADWRTRLDRLGPLQGVALRLWSRYLARFSRRHAEGWALEARLNRLSAGGPALAAAVLELDQRQQHISARQNHEYANRRELEQQLLAQGLLPEPTSRLGSQVATGDHSEHLTPTPGAMKILVVANHTPFISGGADYHVQGLMAALQRYGHEVECLRLPFHFGEGHIQRQMAYAEGLEVAAPNHADVDRVISLQFPAYGVSHPKHVVWLMHQHRVCYELYDPATASPALTELKSAVEAFDTRHLAKAQRLFANSPRVAERLAHYNGLEAEPLYHPPYRAESFTCGDDWGYIFYPSRLEPLKRQALLIKAVALCQQPVRLLLAGEGSQHADLAALIERLQVSHRVRLLGRISEMEKLTFYAHARAVAFPTFDEDYGYVTLEAMLAAKPVITCTDSGGPLAFVQPGHTGWVTEPTLQALAAALDDAWATPRRSAEMGRAGRTAYQQQGISWDTVVARLLGLRH